MDCQDYIRQARTQKGWPEERGVMKVLRKQGLGIRAITREVCRKPLKAKSYKAFIAWVVKQV